MIPLGSRFIVLPHLVLFPTHPIWSDVGTTSLIGMHGFCSKTLKNSILHLLYNLAPKTHPWYPIFLGKSLHSLVLQRMHELSAVGHFIFCWLCLPEPSSSCFNLMKKCAPKMARQGLIISGLTGQKILQFYCWVVIDKDYILVKGFYFISKFWSTYILLKNGST